MQAFNNVIEKTTCIYRNISLTYSVNLNIRKIMSSSINITPFSVQGLNEAKIDRLEFLLTQLEEAVKSGTEQHDQSELEALTY